MIDEYQLRQIEEDCRASEKWDFAEPAERNLCRHVRALLAERAQLKNDDYLIGLLRDRGYVVTDPHEGG